MSIVPFIICLLLYFCICFFGFKLQKLVLSFLLLYVGYQLSNYLLINFVNDKLLLTTISCGVGLILASFSNKLIDYSSFIICFLIVFVLCIDYFDSNILKYGLGSILGILAGCIGIKFIRIIIIFVTSIYGGINLVDLIFNYFSINNNLMLFICTLIIIIIAIRYQYKNSPDGN